MMLLSEPRTGARKSLLLFLAALLFFASYRPATCLISLASLSFDGGRGAGLVQPPKDRPRPTRQQSLTPIERIVCLRAFGVHPRPRDLSPAEETSRAVSAYRSPEGSAGSRARTSLIQPDYLRPSLSDPPSASLSPPL